MQKRNANIKKEILSVFLVCLIALLAIFSKNAQNEANWDHSTFKNAEGLTYSSSNNLDNPIGQPDLIAVVATNGELGYVYYEDFYKSSTFGQKMSPQNSLELFKERKKKIARAFKDAISEFIGIDFLSMQDVEKSLDFLDEPDGVNKAVNSINMIIKRNAEKSAIDIDEIDEHTFKVLYNQAKTEVSIIIPVYEKNGTTQIGEFVVDSF